MLAHANALKREASVRDHLRYWAGLFEACARANKSSVRQMLDLTRVVLDCRCERFSQGQARQRSRSRA
jgi:ABC-type transport system involved in cytochrome c biogenesis ATPase subunit